MTRTKAMIAGAVVAALAFLWAGAGTALAFTDVPDGHRYAPAINELAQLGIVSGRGDGAFRPDDPVSRAQFAKMMCGLLAMEVTEDQSFAPFVDLGPDDPGDFYPHEFVGAAYWAGITKGETATAFCPHASITLAQVITMVVRATDAHHPGLLKAPPARWWGWWPTGDRNHGANIRRAEFADLLASLPFGSLVVDVFRPATRGEVSQILANLIRERKGVTVVFTFEGDVLDFNSPIHVAANRYYLPLADFVKQMGGTLTYDGPTVTIAAHKRTISLDICSRAYTVAGTTSHLRQSALVFEGLLYLSLLDLQKMLDLQVDWEEAAETIALFWNRDTGISARSDEEPQEATSPVPREDGAVLRPR
ncbi:MAG: S-layer homology domain-containing protein [Thermoleophilia bacterium]|nr:S-layer homology domain-containing protein [Thermoleophilia bacterium]